MGHSHSHEGQASHYVEQIFTIAACGAIAGVCILLYARGGLSGMLKEDQHLRVLFGGIGLLILVVIRAAYVWIAAGQTPAKTASHNHNHDHNHDHAACDHDHDHDHDHARCDHDHHHDHDHETVGTADNHNHNHDHHGHDHDHGMAFWRYALLVVPVVLFILGLPAAGGMSAVNASAINDVGGVENAGDKGQNFTIGFNQLELASRNADVRESIAGSTVRLKGQYTGDRSDRFTLVRYKINCCAADAIPLNAVIMLDPAKTSTCKVDPINYRRKWVQVTGKLQFGSRPGSRDVLPVIVLSPKDQTELETELVKEVPPDTNPYAND
jgi:hypothetical protein